MMVEFFSMMEQKYKLWYDEMMRSFDEDDMIIINITIL